LPYALDYSFMTAAVRWVYQGEGHGRQ